MKPSASFRSGCSESGAVLVLPTGGFVGRLQRRSDVAGFRVSEARDDPGVDIPPHRHEDAHFFFPIDRGFESSARGATGELDRGSVLYHPAGTTHADRFVQRGGRFLLIHVQEAELSAAGVERRLPAESLACTGPELGILRERIRFEGRQADASSTAAMESLLLELLDVTAKRRERCDEHAPPFLKQAVELILDDPCGEQSVATIAAAVGVHPVSLARAFRRHLGASPGDYLRWRRIDRALALMRSRRLPLAEVALEAGFSDQSSFTRACRRILGTSPGKYRRALRSG